MILCTIFINKINVLDKKDKAGICTHCIVTWYSSQEKILWFWWMISTEHFGSRWQWEDPILTIRPTDICYLTACQIYLSKRQYTPYKMYMTVFCGDIVVLNAAVTPRRVALTCVQRVVKFCHTSSHARQDQRMILSCFVNVLPFGKHSNTSWLVLTR